MTKDANGNVLSHTEYDVGLMIHGHTLYNAEHPDGVSYLYLQAW